MCDGGVERKWGARILHNTDGTSDGELADIMPKTCLRECISIRLTYMYSKHKRQRISLYEREVEILIRVTSEKLYSAWAYMYSRFPDTFPSDIPSWKTTSSLPTD
jgi:hypothetical protein